MSTDHSFLTDRRVLVGVGLGVVLLLTALILRWEGRFWICSCGDVYLWAGDIWSSHNSQHLFDPYSLTHLLHGLALSWIVVALGPGIAVEFRFGVAVVAEAIWEIAENSRFIIDRYREGTMALGYEGDTILNSLGDVVFCAVGFLVAVRLGVRRSVLLFAATEVVLVLWIRDGLLLNILMLVYPIESIRLWQMGA